MPLIAQRLAQIAPSPTIAMTQMARDLKEAGRDVISLSAGEPDFDTPAHIAEAGMAAIREGQTRYTAVDGIAPLKEAICAKMADDHGIEARPEMVSVSGGGKQVLYNALMASLDPGDEVLIPAPYWVSYPDMVRLAGGVPVILPCPQEDGFKLTPERLRAALTKRSKWLILNSPSNPTGAAYSAAEIGALMEVVRAQDGLHVLSDDIYEKILFDGAEFATPAQIAPDLAPRILTMNGMSKGYAMTGWRIGYGVGPEALIRAMGKVQSQSTSNPCTISQWAALAALTGPQDHIARFGAAFARRRDLVVAGLNAAEGITCATPRGAFYVYPSIAGCLGKTSAGGRAIASDEDFAMALLEEEGVATVFGAAFGLSPHIRISYATSDALLEEAMARIGRFCAGLA